ncbi:hypothetical protein [Aliikangiella sp. IMCC44359]|uniref:hypothetical protein n=1 Tax=Aliikangiella sp. IMCC44359 TaxID=3459125 RepID=UPI00403B2C65
MLKIIQILFIISLCQIIACGGSSSDDDTTPEQKGILIINVSGLPDGTNADITVTGPNNYSQTVTATTTLSNLTVGSYTVTASQVESSNVSYLPALSSQSALVAALETTAIAVVYAELTQTSQQPFPSGLVAASPTDISATSTGQNTPVFMAPATTTWTTAYADAITRINQLLNGEIAVNNAFTPDSFFASGNNANCYGPSLKYSDHPDGAIPNSGELPGGDLMIWQEVDSISGHTCSAAQLNQRLNGVKNQSFAALMSLASMLVVADATSQSLPGVGATLDLTDEMNALGIPGITFSAATITQPTASNYQYEQAYSYDNSTDVYDITVSMQHTPGTSEYEYSGLMAYTITGDNSIFGGGNCQQSDRTLNGSLAYERTSQTALAFQSRTATLCGANISGFVTDNTADDFGQVDVDNRYNQSTNPNGWSENFNLFGAQLNPENLEGSYAYVWQAGVGDSHTRTFLMGVNYNETGGTSIINGEAYAGFGASIESSNGSIQGIICNWAGPGNNHSLQPYVQRQFFSLNESNNLFETPTGGSDIAYAATNSCSYDGTGSFTFDTDLDGDLSDETAAAAISADLMSAFDLDSDGTATIPEAIQNRGYTLPTIPGGFPVN